MHPRPTLLLSRGTSVPMAQRLDFISDVEKCGILHIDKRKPWILYTLIGLHIEASRRDHYLGILLDQAPSESYWESLLNGLLVVYKTYVWLIMKFDGPLWCPILQKDKDQLEMVQRRMTRLPCGRVRRGILITFNDVIVC